MTQMGKTKIMMQYLAELIHAQFENRVPMDLPEELSYDEIIDIAIRGNMQYLLLGAVIRSSVDGGVADRIRNNLKSSTIQTMLQVMKARELDAELEKAGIRHQLLKGSILKQIYPRPELREMSDVDIMIYDDIELADPIIKKLGLQRLEAVKHHVIYQLPPFLVVEAHWDLYEKTVDKEQYLYYKDNFRVSLKEGTQYTYEFSKEDFYVYMVSHFAKHFYEQGCGVRNLVDLFVYRKQLEKELNWVYIDVELKKLGIDEFEKRMNSLATVWLTNPTEADDFQLDLFGYMLDCGIYGKSENGMWGQLAKSESAQSGNVVRNFYFPPYSYMTEQYPWLQGKPILLPFAWVKRAIHGLRDKNSMERKEKLEKMNGADAQKMGKMYRELKLNFRK